MKEIINYVTDDGEIFTNINDAKEHERKIKMEDFGNTIYLFNDSEEEIPLYKHGKWDSAYYAYFTGSPEKAKVFAEIWNEYCNDSCPVDERHYKKGLYAYDEHYDGWIYIPDVIKFYTDMYKNFENKIDQNEERDE